MAQHPIETAVTRRDFLKASAVGTGVAGLTLGDALQASEASSDVRCIFLFLVGGPSHLDTFDPKPNAPAEVRGPFRPLATRIPGIHLSENLPRLAARADRVALIRSLHHRAAPIHETGQQLVQTGRLFKGPLEHPHYGAVLSHLRGSQGTPPAFAVLPRPMGPTGVSISHGQSAGFLGAAHEPVALEPSALLADVRGTARDRYGRSSFGDSCLLAARLIERGTRCVTVNMFDSVFDTLSWDCHADGGSLATTLDDYKDTLCPMFDTAFAALLDDLAERGLFERTLVVATGEFGRTPYLNPRGGRDHWPGVWTALLAGAGIRGGQVIGSSDAIGAEPNLRPVTCAQLAATVYHALRLDPRTRLPGPEGRSLPLAEAQPVLELFS